MDSCWKLIKKYNNEVGIESLKNPIDIIKQFYLTGIISDTDYDNLIQMWRDRNISVHLYEENSFNEILNRLPAHLKVFMTLNEIFHNEVKQAP
jgi:nucleotidyltransferase substrate binding protein (TIGR01987 family)